MFMEKSEEKVARCKKMLEEENWAVIVMWDDGDNEGIRYT